MKLLKAASLLVALAVLIVPASQAASQTLIHKTVARDLASGPFGPGGAR